MDNIETLYKSSEVAKKLGISTATLKNHWKDGLIEAVVINTHRYYTERAVKEYLNNKTKKGNR